jgi:FMN phosphatase YigB (HAD superfamily)
LDGGRQLEWEVEGAQALGIKGIWIDRYRKGLPADSHIRPDHTVYTLAELVDLLDS